MCCYVDTLFCLCIDFTSRTVNQIIIVGPWQRAKPVGKPAIAEFQVDRAKQATAADSIY